MTIVRERESERERELTDIQDISTGVMENLFHRRERESLGWLPIILGPLLYLLCPRGIKVSLLHSISVLSFIPSSTVYILCFLHHQVSIFSRYSYYYPISFIFKDSDLIIYEDLILYIYGFCMILWICFSFSVADQFCIFYLLFLSFESMVLTVFGLVFQLLH